ncbi:MAG: hypothetical protein JW750_10545 [Anaerolineaceae bacterium]|nr:hypothetical protein [Anaerolineaceae bacterium]
MNMLLTTKFHLPGVSKRHIPRPQLVERLNRGYDAGHPVFLISGPAGFGKTTCVSEWLDSFNSGQISWLSLDAADDDPGRFFIYLFAALQKIDPRVGNEIDGMLRAGQLPPAGVLSAALINDLARIPDPFLLVLDDFHVVQDSTILEAISELVQHCPQSLHLVLISREDPPLPLARLRARNQLTEIRINDLRFTHAEIDQFLNEVLEYPLSPGDQIALEERTEGWAAGLHLAGLLIGERQNPSAIIEKLSGSQRYILNYLTEEVLSQQPDDVIRFLLQTSLLDRLHPDLCGAVCGREDSREMLERLYAENLFIIPLDDNGQWYRYHHLFADVLREMQSQNSSAERLELHQRASRWFARQGLINEAIGHALAAEDYETAVQWIEEHAMDLLVQWHVRTVEDWMKSIPAEWIEHSLRANLAFASLHLMRGDPRRAFPHLERLKLLFSGESSARNDPELEARWLALQATLLNAQGQADLSLELCRQALEIAPQDNLPLLSQIHLARSGAYQVLDDYPRALESYQQIFRLNRDGEHSVLEMLGSVGMGLLALQHGELHFAFEVVSNAVARLEQLRTIPPISTALYGELGEVYYLRYQLEEAHEHFQRAIQLSSLSGYQDAELYYGVVLSRLAQISGNLDEAERMIQQSVQLLQNEAHSVVNEEIIAQQVKVLLARGLPERAEAVLRPHGFQFGTRCAYPDYDQDVSRSASLLYVSFLRVLLARALTENNTASLPLAVDLAGRLIDGALQRQYLPLALETLLLRAQIHAALKNSAASRDDYLRALRLGEPEGFVSLFIEEGPVAAQGLSEILVSRDLQQVDRRYLEQILDVFPHSPEKPSASPPQPIPDQTALIDPLSERELEILRLIHEGLTNQEISDCLFITLHTVKKHTSNLYAKLGVNSRTRAISRARELGILDNQR